jgi:hypothetical protein
LFARGGSKRRVFATQAPMSGREIDSFESGKAGTTLSGCSMICASLFLAD